MSTSSMTQKGQVTIPAEMRKALGLKSGVKMRFGRQGLKLTLEAVTEPATDSLFGTLKASRGRGIHDIDLAIDAIRKQRNVAASRTKRK